MGLFVVLFSKFIIFLWKFIVKCVIAMCDFCDNQIENDGYWRNHKNNELITITGMY